MTKKDIEALAHLMAKELEGEQNIDVRRGILAVKYAFEEMLHAGSFEKWSVFNRAWHAEMAKPA